MCEILGRKLVYWKWGNGDLWGEEPEYLMSIKIGGGMNLNFNKRGAMWYTVLRNPILRDKEASDGENRGVS